MNSGAVEVGLRFTVRAGDVKDLIHYLSAVVDAGETGVDLDKVTFRLRFPSAPWQEPGVVLTVKRANDE